jgi:hypothetical protein
VLEWCLGRRPSVVPPGVGIAAKLVVPTPPNTGGTKGLPFITVTAQNSDTAAITLTAGIR